MRKYSRLPWLSPKSGTWNGNWRRSAGVVALLLLAGVALRVALSLVMGPAAESLAGAGDCASCEQPSP